MACAVAVIATTSILPAAGQSPSATPYDVSLFKWSIAEDVEGFDQDPLFYDLAIGDDGRVLLVGAVQRDGVVTPAVWGSDDGRTWSRLEGELPDGSVAYDAVPADDDGFLVIMALGDDVPEDPLFRSDGTRLAPMAFPDEVPIAIERSPAGVHVLDVSGAPTVWTSADDGTTWTSAEVAGEDAIARELAVTDDGTIVVLGLEHAAGLETPTAWSSRDGGVTWQAATLPLDAGSWSIGDLAWTPIGLLARILDGAGRDEANVNLLSRDGVTWDTTYATTGDGSVGSAGPEAIVFGTDSAWHTRDGVSWTQEWWPTLAGFDIVANRQMPSGPVVAAGIRTSSPATGATFLGAPAPKAPPSGPIEQPSASPS
jgi:hypothetical protein